MTSYVVATAFGGPEVLRVHEEELAPPTAGQVLVAVRAAGVNPYDYKVYGGALGRSESTLPMRLGSEAAGVVLAIGDQAGGAGEGVRVGDEVIVYRANGAYAEQLLVKVSAVVGKPAEMSFEQAAGLMLTGTTAVHMLVATEVGHGDTVLVHGAAGGVGLMVVQIAKARGAHVIGTASVRHHQTLTRYGVTPVEYGDGLTERVLELSEDVTVALDCVGSDEAIDTSLALVTDRNRVATIAAFTRGAEAGIKVLGNGPGADPGTQVRDAARLELVALVEEGQLEVTVEASFALADVADAHRAVAAGHTQGKVVLVP